MKAFLLKIDDAVYIQWQDAAKSAGVSVSEWIRGKCNGHSARGPEVHTGDVSSFSETVKPERKEKVPRRKLGAQRQPLTDREVDAAAAQVFEQEPEYQALKRIKTCPHGKEKGWNCGLCGGMAKVGE